MVVLRSFLFTFLLLFTGEKIITDELADVTYYAAEILKSLCQHYNIGDISGDWCYRICYQATENVPLVSFHNANKIVLVLSLNGQNLTLKSQYGFFSQFEQLPNSWLNESAYLDKIIEATTYYLQLDWPRYRIRHLLEIIWPAYKRNNVLTDVDKRSLWTLINQEEYLTSTVLQSAEIFPKVVGSCGHVYVVEQVLPFKLDTNKLYSKVRGKILLHLFGTLKLLSDFINEPLHWCDVKFDNLALSPNYVKRFVIMDADMIYTDSRMHALFHSMHCNVDDDCQFFDCTATCNVTIGRCANRTNTNLDLFCQKLIPPLMNASVRRRTDMFVQVCFDNMTDEQRRKAAITIIVNYLNDI